MTSRLKYFAEDLLTLEINTIIVKDKITESKVFHPRQALIEIANDYSGKLSKLGCTFEGKMKTFPGSPESFDEINMRAKCKICEYKASGSKVDKAKLWMLYRIKSTTRSILNIFDGHKPGLLDRANDNKELWDNELRLPFKTDELSIIRKAWELSTEEIAMQTVIQLDGDVITRIQPKYTKEINNGLREIHNLGVETSIKVWKTLVSTVLDFVKTIWKLISPI